MTIILYGLTAVFGALAIIGTFTKNSTCQIVGLIFLVFSYLAAIVIEYLNKDKKRPRRKGDE